MTAKTIVILISLAFGYLCNAALLPDVETTNVCPDKRSACPEGATCCAEPDSSWGCCPMKNAVCCSDKLHCCPSHTVCDLRHETCNNASTQSMAFSLSTLDPEIVPFTQIIVGHAPHGVKHENGLKLNGITVCPDYKTACPDNFTCCPSKTGFGCCPGLNAVCCGNSDSCCPNSSFCDPGRECFLITYLYDEGDNVLAEDGPIGHKLAGISLDASFSRDLRDGQVCPDGESTCANGSTCCKIPGVGYGCCPYPKANCCSDGIHCCPAAYTCDVAHQQCKKQAAVGSSKLTMMNFGAIQH